MTTSQIGQIEFEHYHRYCFARDLCDGLDVLDVAAGEGYGAALIAGIARSVTGVEIDAGSVDHATANYRAANLRFLEGDALALPLPDVSVDIVLSFETLEHLTDQDCFIAEVRRVLRPGGLFVVSTPDRAVYSAPGAEPNPYHVQELTDLELRSLLQANFAHVDVLAQRPLLGSVLASTTTPRWRSYERRAPDICEASSGLARAHYLVAVASDGALPDCASSVYIDRRRVHDVMQDALRLPDAAARAATFMAERDEARAEAARLADAHAALDAALRVSAEALHAAERRAADTGVLRDKLARDAAELAAVQKQLAQTRAALAEAETRAREQERQGIEDRDRLELERDTREQTHAASIQTLHRANHAFESALQAALGQAHEAARARDAILYSTSWRVLAPMRAAGTRFPRLARSLRRAAKLAWWTATLQIGHRVTLRREWRAAMARDALAPPSPPPEVPQFVAPSCTSEDPLSPEPDAAPAPAPVEALPLAPMEAPPPAPMEAPPPDVDLRRAFALLHRGAVIHFPPVATPEVSVVIPVYKGLPDLENCLRSLAVSRAGEPSFEVVLVDDCPAEAVLWAVPDSGGLRKIANTSNLGFLMACNAGAAAARGRILCLLNSDTIVFPGWLSSLVHALDETPGAGLAGGMLINTDGSIQEAGWRILGNGWGHPIGRGGDVRDGAYTYRRPVDCVSGACFAITKQLFDELGGLDPAYAPAFYEEFDLAFRARARGFAVIYEPKSRVVHLGSASYGAERRDTLSGEHHAIFAERFADPLRKHPWDNGDEFALRHPAAAGPVLLVVDHGIPKPDRHAGDVTMTQYLCLLATAGWSVVFGPADGVADGPAADALERQGIELIRAPRTIEGWLADHGAHVREVWLARPEIAERLIGPVRAHTRAPIVYYPHDLHHLRLEREAALRGDPALAAEAARVRAQEIAVLRAVDRVTAPSAADAALVGDLAPSTAVTVLPPYVYEPEQIVSYDAPHFAGLSDVVFVGGFPHTPNVDAAVFITREVMPLVWRDRPDVRLILIGYAPPPEVLALAGDRVVVTGQVPLVEPYLERACVMLAALRFGAGVKGKVVDAMRLGVPVVTTSIGIEGIGIAAETGALVAEDAAGLAEQVLALLGDPQHCATLSAAGAALVGRDFSRAAARAALNEVFRTPRCAVCGSAELFAPPADGSFREAFVCRNCFALGRAEALGRVVLGRLAAAHEGSLAELARRPHGRSVHEFGFVGCIADTWRAQPWYTMSEFFDDVSVGERNPDGVRCEDLTRLTFADASFDMLISQDVLEHVPDPACAFAESARVLRPGGTHVFTIPQSLGLAASVQRARLDPYGIEYLFPPEYHGDPIRAEGALVFTEFGRDLGAIVARAGLTLVEHDLPVLGGQDGQTLRVFEARKQDADT